MKNINSTLGEMREIIQTRLESLLLYVTRFIALFSTQCTLNKISISESVVAGKCGIIMNCKW